MADVRTVMVTGPGMSGISHMPVKTDTQQQKAVAVGDHVQSPGMSRLAVCCMLPSASRHCTVCCHGGVLRKFARMQRVYVRGPGA